MKKLIFLFTLSLLLVGMAWGQTSFTATYTFGGNGNVASFTYNGTTYAGLTMGTIDKVGVTTSSSNNNFRANDWSLGAVDTGKYIGFTMTATSGYKFTVNTINYGIGRSGTGTRDSEWRGSADSYAALINNYTTLNGALTNYSGVINNPDANSNWTGNVLTLGSSYADLTTSCGFRLYMYNSEATGGTAGLAGPITISGTFESVGGTPTPTISVDPATLTDFGYLYGSTTSTSQSYTLSGANLTGFPANITVTGSTNYEVSTDDVNFAPSTTVAYTSATLANTTIYVRLKTGLDIGAYNSETISNAGGGATTVNVTCSGSVTAPAPSATVTLRPSQIDISGATSESAVLMSVANYPSNDAKYRLYSGSNNYNCWDSVSETYISSQSYVDGPNIPGTPSTSSTWWIPFQRGDNNSTVASYRDRISPYSVNYQTVALPTATAITTPASIEKSDVTFINWTDNTVKYIILGYDATSDGVLISATSTELGTGSFSLKMETGTTIKRIEVRSLDNTLIESVTGTWPIDRVATPTFNPAAGAYYTAQNVSISSTTTGATVYYSTSSATGPWTQYGSALNVAATTTIWAYAKKTGMTDSAVSSAIYTFPTTVSNIAALRAGDLGTMYELTGEAILTFQQSTRNQKYIQDATAAILIDDVDGNITTTYALYDGITGIVGSLSSYGGMLQFIPATDPGIATSSDNVIVPEVRTLNSLTSADQAKLIMVQEVLIDDTAVNFGLEAQNIDILQDLTILTLRTFPATDYSGQPIPAEPIDMICLVGEFNTAMQVSPRFLADFITIPAYDYPEGDEVDAGEVLITVTGGNGNIVNQPLTPVPNPNFEVVFEQAIELTGDGPWTVKVFSLDTWVACLFDGAWQVTEVPIDGYVHFWLEFPEVRNTVIELKSGNGDSPTLPVELSSFTVALNSSNQAVLTWVTQTETGVNGFYIYRSNEGVLADALLISSLIPATNSSQQQVYIYRDKELNGAGTYYYWLQVSDLNGSESYHGPVTLVYEDGNDQQTPVIPKVTELKKVFPNPFNPSATISYSLVDAAPVSIKIYNSRGQMVRSFEEGLQNAGSYNLIWNGEDNSGRSLPTGVYYIRMQAGQQSFNKKAVLMK
ncbi:MAG: FlgD immunoglobulin-like domain containing protein [Candidatus Cloacimonetes bacterium]|nr:FlgD immunoglobulin-like domain containing protein [Candidatus Cloacimonadota bacterium]